MMKIYGKYVLGIVSAIAVLFACSKNPAGEDSPSAPSELIGLATGAYSVNLQWTDNSDNETSFLIYRKITGSYEQAGMVEADRNFYNDAIPVSCIEVNYYIVAENGGGRSERSNEITVPLLCGDGP